MRSAPSHRKQGRIKRKQAGFHAAPPSPSRWGFAARRAVKVAPALAVVGALAAAPQVRALIGTSPGAPSTAGADQLVAPAHAGRGVLAPLAIVTHDPYRLRLRDGARHGGASSGAARQPSSGRATGGGGPAGSGGGASPRPSPSKAATTGLRCSGSGGMLPQNYAAIVTFLTSHGYTRLAAAGIAGNIYQESMGNPESVGTGGGGLIGWTPLPAGFVTGNVAADLRTQLQALLTYNKQWAQYIPALNAATSATEAADIYMTDFERPGVPAAGNREAAAEAVASACGL